MMIPAIWTAMYAEMSLPQALKTLNTQGWTAFEMSTEHFEEIANADHPAVIIEDTLACMEELGLYMPQGHAYLQARVADFNEERRKHDISVLERHINIAAQLGVKVLVMHPGGTHLYTTRTDCQHIRALNADAFRHLGNVAAEHGINIGLENLRRRSAATPEELWDLIDAIDHPSLGFALDTSHAHLADVDIHAAILEFSPRLWATHISDNDHSGDQHLTPGSGHIDWVGVMAALSEINYTGLFNLEIPGERHPVLQMRDLKSQHAFRICQWLLSLV